MAHHIHYRKLCGVRIDHDPSLDLGSVELGELSPDLQDQQLANYDIHRILEIMPTAETENVMARQRIRIRKTPLGFEIAGSVDGDKLERPADAGTGLWFLLFPKVRSFAASANLPLDGPLSEILHFTTRHGSDQLTRPIPVFDPATRYRAGNLAVDGEPPTVLLEAMRDLAPAAAHVAADWLELPARRYVNGADYTADDRVLWGAEVFVAKSDGAHPEPPAAPWTLASAPDLRNGASRADRVLALPRSVRLPLSAPVAFVRFTIRDADGGVVETGVRHRDPPERLDALEFALPHAARGIYQVDAADGTGSALPGFPLDFLLLPEISTKPLAVIEIQVGPENALIFAPDGSLLEPVYQLRFRKRHTFWRYTFHGDLSALPPADPGDLVAAGADRFVTPEPLPLTGGLVALRKFDGKTSLPNPPVGQVARDGDRLFSDSFIRL
jgi:hypothetical protein